MTFTAHDLNNLHRYALPVEIDWIHQNAPSFEGAKAVMIGAGPGVLGLAFMEATRGKGDLTVVDIKTTSYCQKYMEQAGFTAKYITADSYVLGKRWKEPLDFLIVDGDHSFEGVSRDIEAWMPHVKYRELAFFHDFFEREGGFNGTGEWENSGVAEAIFQHDLCFLYTVGISAIVEK